MRPVAYSLAEENNIPLKAAECNFILGTCTKKGDILVMPTLTKMCILGGDLMKEFKIVLYFHESCIEAEGFSGKTPIDVGSIEVQEGQTGLSLASAEQIQQLDKLFDKLVPLGSDELGCTKICEHIIDVQGATPIRQNCHPVFKILETDMHRQVNDFFRKGVTVPSNSEWASPIVLVHTDQQNVERGCLPPPQDGANVK